MGIIRGAAKLATFGPRMAGRPVKKSLMYGTGAMVAPFAVAAGVGASFMDANGPWAQVRQDLYGDPDIIGASMKASIGYAMGASKRQYENYGVSDYQYGRSINNRRSSAPSVPGDIVFGMYNTRR